MVFLNMAPLKIDTNLEFRNNTVIGKLLTAAKFVCAILTIRYIVTNVVLGHTRSFMATGACVFAVSSLTPERSIGAILERKNNIYNSFLWYDWNIKACNIKSILWDLITYRCSKLVDYLLRVEQKARSHPHTFLGRCWDGIRLRFHKGKLLCHQVQSSGNCWSG